MRLNKERCLRRGGAAGVSASNLLLVEEGGEETRVAAVTAAGRRRTKPRCGRERSAERPARAAAGGSRGRAAPRCDVTNKRRSPQVGAYVCVCVTQLWERRGCAAAFCLQDANQIHFPMELSGFL